jgi:16S rRNA (cytosine967-C5)-methyltransferase
MTDTAKAQVEPQALELAGGALAPIVEELWQRIRMEWRFASAELARAFRSRRGLGSDQRRAVAETLYGMIRHLRRLDFALEGSGRIGENANRRDRLRRLAYLVLEADLAPEQAAALEPSIDWSRVAGADERIAAVRTPWRRLALAASLPDWLARELASQWGERAPALAAALVERATMTVRVNRLRGAPEVLAAELAAAGIATSPGRFAADALILETRTNLFSLPAFRAGQLEAQDEGSQLIAELVAPPPRATVIDFCAGAGGKSLALAAAMGNRGRLVAVDVEPRKLAELRRRARRAGVDNAQAVVIDEAGDRPLPPALERLRGRAHRVLVDAPCSGLGALRRNPEIKWRLQPGDLQRLPELQLSILERALPLVAAGGRLIYATCTVLDQENRLVVAELGRRHPALIPVSPVEIWGRERAGAITDDGGRFLELTPERHGTDGFFAAVWRKPAA